MQYYKANGEEFKDTLLYQNGRTGENSGWVIEWEDGLGKGQQDGEGIVPPKAQNSNSWIIYAIIAVIVIIALIVIISKSKKKKTA